MKYISVCSGIEAATVAWHDLGWTPVAFSEIEPFPSAVLAHHYPDVPNVGDMTKFKEWNLDGSVDLLVGGTPCQSFSVAGLRKGLDDPRGNLMLTFLAIAERERPKWIVWENVPGVLSSNGGRDFGTFLAALGELGYGWAYRVLDAQWFGVAQRRRRVFVVGCLGDQASAAKVLFESESVQRNPAPSREARQGAARGVARCFAGSSESGVAATLETTSHDYSRADGFNMVAQPVAFTRCDNGQDAAVDVTPTMRCGSNYSAHLAVAQPVAQPITFGAQMSVPQTDVDMVQTLQAKNPMAVAQPVAIPIHDQATRHGGKRGDKQDGKGNGFGVGNPGDPCPTLTKGDKHAVAQPVAFAQNTRDEVRLMNGDGSIVGALAAEPGMKQTCYVAQPVALGTDCYNGAITGEVAATIGTPGSSVNASGPTVMQAVDVKQVQWASGGGQVENNTAQALRAGAEYNYQFARIAMQVRRLTPTECERLQGFPDGYTNIPWRKKDEAPDGPRYKALGNSMAVPCMKWIGQRIAEVDRGD